MNEAFTIYKLIILYTLNEIESPLTFGLISDYLTGHESNTYNTAYYEITPAGRETLELFGNTLSREIRQEIDEYLQANNHEIIQRVTLISDYSKNTNGEYTATCSLMEKNIPIFELKLSVPDEEDAIRICNNWRASSDDLYAMAVKNLLRPTEETE